MRKRVVLSAVVVVLASVFCLCPAFGKPLSPNYATLKLGGYFPQHGDLDGFDSGFNGEVSVGRVVAPGFAVEGGLGYFETKGDFVAPGTAAHEKIKVTPLTVSFKGLAYFQQFEPYAEAGLGVYFIEDKVSGTVLGTPVSDSDSDAKVGFHLGLGANVNVTRQLFLGLEGKYIWVKSDAFDIDTRLNGITLTGNIGFRF